MDVTNRYFLYDLHLKFLIDVQYEPYCMTYTRDVIKAKFKKGLQNTMLSYFV